MITRLKSKRIILRDRIISGFVYIDGEKIIYVGDEERKFDTEFDFGDKFISPGFIDIHTHGGGGYAFEKCAEEVIGGVNFHLSNGTTSILPTISAAPIEKMREAVEYVKAAKESGRALANIIGAHLEGPYLSRKQCGAQSPSFITPPNEEEYLSLFKELGKYIARVSYAPENDGDYKFTKALKENGIVASAGHTDATYEELLPAIELGCRLITHLYSCTSTVTRTQGFRHLGVIETAYLSDEVKVEIIADGRHLPPELIKLIIKNKGIENIALITDSLAVAGTGVIHGFMEKTEFIVEDGVCKLCDRSAFAGSIATADRLIRVMRDEVGLELYEAVSMLTAVPAEIMGLNKGLLKTGFDADIIVFDDNVSVSDVFVMGRAVVFGQNQIKTVKVEKNSASTLFLF